MIAEVAFMKAIMSSPVADLGEFIIPPPWNLKKYKRLHVASCWHKIQKHPIATFWKAAPTPSNFFLIMHENPSYVL